MKRVFTLEEVQSAFKRLEEHAAVRGVDADFLDMIQISGYVATSATDCILGVNRAWVCRAVRQEFLKNAHA